MSARVMQIIVTELERRGDGEADPLRIIRQYWSMDGNLLAEVDPLRDGGRFAHPYIPSEPRP